MTRVPAGSGAEVVALVALAAVLVLAMFQPRGVPEAVLAVPTAAVLVALGVVTPAGGVRHRRPRPRRGRAARLRLHAPRELGLAAAAGVQPDQPARLRRVRPVVHRLRRAHDAALALRHRRGVPRVPLVLPRGADPRRPRTPAHPGGAARTAHPDVRVQRARADPARRDATHAARRRGPAVLPVRVRPGHRRGRGQQPRARHGPRRAAAQHRRAGAAPPSRRCWQTWSTTSPPPWS
jgi:hypothetical protein